MSSATVYYKMLLKIPLPNLYNFIHIKIKCAGDSGHPVVLCNSSSPNAHRLAWFYCSNQNPVFYMFASGLRKYCLTNYEPQIVNDNNHYIYTEKIKYYILYDCPLSLVHTSSGISFAGVLFPSFYCTDVSHSFCVILYWDV